MPRDGNERSGAIGQRAGGWFRPVTLAWWREAVDPAFHLRITDRHHAQTLLRASKRDATQMAALRRWARAHGLRASDPDDTFLDHLVRAILDGRILVLAPDVEGAKLATVVAETGTTAAPEDPPPQNRPTPRPRPRAPDPEPAAPVPPPPPPAPATQKTWIEFYLIDEATNAPIADVPFKIELTDGSVVDRTTDGAGKIRIDDIDPGTCAIREIRADDGASVTSVS